VRELAADRELDGVVRPTKLEIDHDNASGGEKKREVFRPVMSAKSR